MVDVELESESGSLICKIFKELFSVVVFIGWNSVCFEGQIKGKYLVLMYKELYANNINCYVIFIKCTSNVSMCKQDINF